MVEKLGVRQHLVKDWLPLALVSGVLGCLGTAVIMAGWTPDTAVVGWTIGLGMLVGWLLATGNASWRLAGLVHLGYALAITIIILARLWPGNILLADGWLAHSRAMEQNWALFADRIGGWLLAVFNRGSSQETVVFEFGLGFTGWLLAGAITWAVFRQGRPITSLIAGALLLALSNYYGRTPLWPLIAYIGLAGLLAAVTHFRRFEQEWQQRGSDYSDELRLDLWLQSTMVIMAVTSAAATLPALNYQAGAQFLRDRPLVQRLETEWEQLFGAVTIARPPAAQPAGSFPRSFLLGDPPELRETVVMTTLITRPQAAADLRYWRGISYDIYDGRGWIISTERQQTVAAGQGLTLLPAAKMLDVEQQVTWLADDRVLRYTLGEPRRFDHEMITLWRGSADLSRVQGYQPSYTAVSRISVAAPADLRQANMGGISPALLARYTALPPDLPSRIGALAQQVAGQAPTAYDQARALERFLRQYEYSLAVELPPRQADAVDFFLFEMQRGYCDYYASAMVVMARSLGLPARLVTGYLAQPPDVAGRQTIYANQAHSWTEIYLGKYGWIAFEPTAAFDPGYALNETGIAPIEVDIAAPPPLPEVDQPERLLSIWLLGSLAALSLLIWLAWRWQQAEAGLDGVEIAYSRLQTVARRLGQPTPRHQTPHEFAAALLACLAAVERPPRRWLPEETAVELAAPVQELAALFAVRQYGRIKPEVEKEAIALWRRLRRPLWWRKSWFYR